MFRSLELISRLVGNPWVRKRHLCHLAQHRCIEPLESRLLLSVVTDVPGRVTAFNLPSSTTGGSSISSLTAGPDGNVWFADGPARRIGQVSPSGIVTLFDLGEFDPLKIATGPDGNLWFIQGQQASDQFYTPFIGRISTQGVITQFDTGYPLFDLASGPDGKLWFTELGGIIGTITTSGTVQIISPGGDALRYSLINGPDGNMWFIDSNNNSGASQIARITPAGSISSQTISGASPSGLTSGADGNVWFTKPQLGNVVRITPLGVVTEFSDGITSGQNQFEPGASQITSGPDGNLWFTETSNDIIGRIDPDGTVTEFAIEIGDLPSHITSGPDGNIWFINFGSGGYQVSRLVGPTNVSLTSASTFASGSPSNLTLTLTSGAGVPTGSVTVTVDNGSPQLLPLVNGVAQFPLTALGVGTHTISADYADQGLILGGHGRTTVIVTPPLPKLSINDVTVNEGNTATSNASFTITLSPASTQPVTIAVATADGTASSGSDYTSRQATLTFAPGETTKNFVVPILGDTVRESDETYFVNLSNAINSTIGKGQAQGTIRDDDAPSNTAPVAVSATVNAASGVTFAGTLEATDVDGDPVTFNLVADALNGTVAVQSNGSFTYTPASGFVGNDAFTFKVNDGSVDSDPASVKIKVNTAQTPVGKLQLSGLNGSIISNQDASPSSADGTDFGTADVNGSAVTRTFTITNTGAATLNLTGTPVVSLTGTGAADFSVVSAPNPTLAAGAATTFQLRFVAGAAGARSATVSLASSDSSQNPFTFQIQGTGQVPSAIPVQQIVSPANTISVSSGQDVNIVARYQTLNGNGQPASLPSDGLTLLIHFNSQALTFVGFKGLTSQGSPFTGTPQPETTATADTDPETDMYVQVLFSSNDIDFPSQQPLDLLTAHFTALPGKTGTTRVTFTADPGLSDPTTLFGFKSTPVTVSVAAPANAPQFELAGLNGTVISNSDTTPDSLDGTDFGSVPINGGSVTRTFTIKNNGTAPLTLSGPSLIAPAIFPGPGFSIASQPSATVAPGASTTFQVKFTPTTTGLHTAFVSINSNDSSQNPFTFEVSGTGTTNSVGSGAAYLIETSKGTTRGGKKATLIDPAIGVFTTNSAASLSGVRLTVSAELDGLNGSNPKDVLQLLAQGKRPGQLNLFKKSQIRVGSVVIGNVAGGTKGVPLTVTFNNNAVMSDVKLVARRIAFRSTQTGLRHVEFLLTDGLGQDGDPAFKDITV